MAYPPAYMGFVGFVKFVDASSVFTVRAESADLKLQQAITKPELVTGKYDRTVYQLGPKEVEGSVSFPAIMENAIDAASGTTAVVPRLWRKAIVRGVTGGATGPGRLSTFDHIIVRYTSDNAIFDFTDCIIDSFEFNVAQSDLVKITTNVKGVNRTTNVPAEYSPEPQYNTRNSRAVTWNDAIVEIKETEASTNSEPALIDGSWIRNFTATVANNTDRFYTLNGKLTPQDIAAKVRDISGSMTIMGRHNGLGTAAESNSTRCSEARCVRFGYSLSTGCRAEFIVKLPGCIFEIETMTLTNDLLETSVNWHSLPGVRWTNALGDESFIESTI